MSAPSPRPRGRREGYNGVHHDGEAVAATAEFQHADQAEQSGFAQGFEPRDAGTGLRGPPLRRRARRWIRRSFRVIRISSWADLLHEKGTTIVTRTMLSRSMLTSQAIRRCILDAMLVVRVQDRHIRRGDSTHARRHDSRQPRAGRNGGRERESNPPETVSRPQPVLKTGRPTGDDALPAKAGILPKAFIDRSWRDHPISRGNEANTASNVF